jgi:hypothetical protein
LRQCASQDCAANAADDAHELSAKQAIAPTSNTIRMIFPSEIGSTRPGLKHSTLNSKHNLPRAIRFFWGFRLAAAADRR